MRIRSFGSLNRRQFGDACSEILKACKVEVGPPHEPHKPPFRTKRVVGHYEMVISLNRKDPISPGLLLKPYFLGVAVCGS